MLTQVAGQICNGAWSGLAGDARPNAQYFCLLSVFQFLFIFAAPRRRKTWIKLTENRSRRIRLTRKGDPAQTRVIINCNDDDRNNVYEKSSPKNQLIQKTPLEITHPVLTNTSTSCHSQISFSHTHSINLHLHLFQATEEVAKASR